MKLESLESLATFGLPLTFSPFESLEVSGDPLGLFKINKKSNEASTVLKRDSIYVAGPSLHVLAQVVVNQPQVNLIHFIVLPNST